MPRHMSGTREEWLAARLELLGTDAGIAGAKDQGLCRFPRLRTPHCHPPFSPLRASRCRMMSATRLLDGRKVWTMGT